MTFDDWGVLVGVVLTVGGLGMITLSLVNDFEPALAFAGACVTLLGRGVLRAALDGKDKS